MKRKIVITGGGTAGHIFAALEVLCEIEKKENVKSLYIGGKGNIEEELVKDIPFKSIPVGKLRRYFSIANFRDLFRAVKGSKQAYDILKGFQPDVVFSKGGYVSLPVVIASHFLKIPVVLHESDTVIGLANKISSKIAEKVCVGFPLKHYPKHLQSKLVYTGTPVRKEFFKKASIKDRQLFNIKKNLPVVFIVGGSQGSQAINNAIKPILEILLLRTQIIHVAGPDFEKEFTDIKSRLPKEVKSNYHPFGFLKDGIISAVKISDLTISRSGSAIAEFAAAGVPMILIPLPTAASNHQVLNSESYCKEGAAVVIQQNHLSSSRLMKLVLRLLADETRLENMSRRAKHVAKPEASKKVAEEILKVIND